jgi:hypothetical protein
MPVYALTDELELQEMAGKPEPPDTKLVTYGEKPWVVVVAVDPADHPEYIFVYGPYSSKEVAQEAMSKLVLFSPYHIIQCEDL